MRWRVAAAGCALALPAAGQSVTATAGLGVARYAHHAPGDTTAVHAPVLMLAVAVTSAPLAIRLSYGEGPLTERRHMAVGGFAAGWEVIPRLTLWAGARAVADIMPEDTRRWLTWYVAGDWLIPLAPTAFTADVTLALAPLGTLTQGASFEGGWAFGAGLTRRIAGGPVRVRLGYRLDHLRGADGATRDVLETVTLEARYHWR